jgi:hypothetical protein
MSKPEATCLGNIGTYRLVVMLARGEPKFDDFLCRSRILVYMTQSHFCTDPVGEDNWSVIPNDDPYS